MGSLYIFVAILALICVLGFFNEKVTKLTFEIALMLFSTIIGVVVLIVVTVASDTDVANVLREVQGFDIHDFLMHGVLCYMLLWGGLRGGLSVALAMSTKGMLPEDMYFIILGCTYAVVFFTTVVQGLTMKPVYEKLSKGVDAS